MDRRGAGVLRFCGNTAETRAWLALARLPCVPPADIRAAIDAAGGAAELVRALIDGCDDRGLPPAVRATLRTATRRPDTAVERWLECPRHHLVAYGDADYPEALAKITGPPLVLYVDGDVDALHLPQLAIVGSRRPTTAGRELAYRFGAEFGRAGLAVTSGLALGIDAAAHRGALSAGGRTLAVCGTGLGSVYPPEHAGLAREIADHGALVSEFPLDFPPRASHFPQRNRVISGLSLGVLVVEAALRSGSLITARMAGEQGRAVFAVPGSIHNPMARGCHRLIRDGAVLVEASGDIIAELDFSLVSPDAATCPDARQAGDSPASPLDRGREMLLNAVGFDPVDLDTLVERTGLEAQVLSARLLMLEIEGEVESRGGRFCRASSGRSS